MKIIFCLLGLLIPCLVSAQTKDMSKTDILTFTSGASVLAEQRRVGQHADDFQKAFPAAKIDPQTMIAVTTTAEHRIDGQPLLWFAADKTQAVLDERCFSDLTMVNVTTLAEGGKITLGKLNEPGRKLAPRAVAWFLMQSGVIQTFVHLEATVHLDSEKSEPSRYEAIFSGKHLYYTDERHESAFRFRFVIEDDGTLRVES
ncbi:MAG: hypothetical protein ACKVY0_12765 [Prosthecobacter sp.]|uniref:hypothetical protein n=1 Tax=Prosthecobacter sp. TaxID=1965333 RepID=UPI003901BEB3